MDEIKLLEEVDALLLAAEQKLNKIKIQKLEATKTKGVEMVERTNRLKKDSTQKLEKIIDALAPLAHIASNGQPFQVGARALKFHMEHTKFCYVLGDAYSSPSGIVRDYGHSRSSVYEFCQCMIDCIKRNLNKVTIEIKNETDELERLNKETETIIQKARS